MKVNEYINKLLSGESLSRPESFTLFSSLPGLNQDQQYSIIKLLCLKGESKEELQGAYDYFSQYSLTIENTIDAIDIVGTGGDQLGTFNISTASSLVIASLGINVAKHGGRSVTSKAGSSDVIDALGIIKPETQEDVLHELKTVHFCYLFAPFFNNRLKDFASLRRQFKAPTIFNMLCPLLNPISPQRIVIGVSQKRFIGPISEFLINSQVEHALVIHGESGMDEIDISGMTHLIEIRGSYLNQKEIYPENLGLNRHPLSEIQGGTNIENATLIESIFSGECPGAPLDAVLLNSSAGLYVSGQVSTLDEGIECAKEAIRSGKTSRLLTQIKKQ
jgi:anthranilate phosphoribosyltransferase